MFISCRVVKFNIYIKTFQMFSPFKVDVAL